MEIPAAGSFESLPYRRKFIGTTGRFRGLLLSGRSWMLAQKGIMGTLVATATAEEAIPGVKAALRSCGPGIVLFMTAVAAP